MSEDCGASSSSVANETSHSQRHNVVKSYGISIDSSKIHEVAIEDRPEDLQALGVNIFDQDVFEEGVLQQVDEAIAEQEEFLEKERLNKELKSIQNELRNVQQKLHRPGLKQAARELIVTDLERLKQHEENVSQRLHKLDNQKASSQDEIESEHTISDVASEDSLDKVLYSENHEETETERLVRLGEMTPFGSIVESSASDGAMEKNWLKHSDRDVAVDSPKHGDDTVKTDDGDLDLAETGQSTLTKPAKDKDEANFASEFERETDIPAGDSDEEYIPDEEELKLSFQDDEHFLPDDSRIETVDDVSIATKKTRSPKVKAVKKTRRIYQTVHDDGDDRAFQIRIREYKLKQSLREKGIEYEGQDEEEDEFWNEQGLDEEFGGGLKIPAVIWNKLFRYQKTGVKWLWELHTQQAGGIVGDEMGLGKTIQIIAFLAGLKYSKIGRRASKQNGLGPILIICPATVLIQWVAEFHKWWPEFRVAMLHDTGSYKGNKDTLITKIRNEPGVLLTTYSGVRLNQDYLLQSRWDYVILDEGHIIRNPDAEVTLTCKQFRTPHRLVLSGSPMQNNLRELWSLFDFVYPGKLGTLPVFMQEFSVPITMGGYSNATSVQVQTAYKCACVLRDTINPYLLRRLKKDVKMNLNLPNKNEQVLFCRLTEEQIEIYKEYLASRDVSSILSGNMKVFPGLIMLRKICNHPDLTTEAGSLWKLRQDEAQRDSTLNSREENDGGYGCWKRAGKLIVVQSLLKLWKKQKHKVLLFTQTRQMLKILEIFIKSQGYNYCRMDGTTSISSRQPLINKFNTDRSIFVFLLTTRVGGLGVNLVGANRVIIYDPDWNPGTDMQARERAWRVGQKKDVTIYRLLTTGTIEEKIYHRQIFKQFLTNRVLKDPKQRRFFKSNDLFELFTLDTSDNKESGTETGAIFAGLGCEVAVPQKSKSSKKKHTTPRNENVLKTIHERAKEILKTQFSTLKEKSNEKSTNKNEPTDVEQTNDVHKSELSTLTQQPKEDEKRREPKSKVVNTEQEMDTSVSRNVVVNDESCGTTSELKSIGETTSKMRNGEQLFRDETATVCEAEESGSRERETKAQISKKVSKNSGDEKDGSAKMDSGLAEGKGKEIKKKSKKRKRNKVEGIRIGQLSHSEPYDARKDSSDVDHNADDDYILRKLFKKSGVQSAMQHDTIVNSGNADHVLVENEAKRVAAQAAEAVKRSRDQCMQLRHTGLPTWTGQSGVVGSPHGLQGKTLFGPKTKTQHKESAPTLFSGKSLLQKREGEDATKPGLGEPMSSTQLLARMRARNFSVAGSSSAGSDVPSNEQKYVDTITEVRNFIAVGCSLPGRATTQEILAEFSSRLPTSDSAIFREMLRNICHFDRGSSGEGFWVLKPEFT